MARACIVGTCVLLWVCVCVATRATAQPIVVDDFERDVLWTPHPADGVELAIASDGGATGRAIRLDVHFAKGGGYAVARRAVSLDLPENYRFRFQIRGDIPNNNFEFKLIDSTGANVWWLNRRDFAFPKSWQPMSIKKRQITFAWGPVGGGEIRHVAAIEIAITAGSGGRGSVWLDEMVLEPLPPPDATPPALEASATPPEPAGPRSALRAVDGDPATAWTTPGVKAGGPLPVLTVDLGTLREFGGLSLLWEPGRRPRDYAIELSEDGSRWRTVRVVKNGGRDRDDLDLPDSEARQIRMKVLALPGSKGIALRELVPQSLAFGATESAFLSEVAKHSPRGTYPRGFVGEQSYWTVVGIDRDYPEALLDEDGALETGKGAWSIEPFLWVGGKLLSWADGASEQRLTDGDPPLPRVLRNFGDLGLAIEPTALGEPGAAQVHVRYRITNRGARAIQARLYLALRPLTVNPPTQFLNLPGGVGRMVRVERDPNDERIVHVDDRGLALLTPPTGFGAATFDEGDVVADFLRKNRLPAAPSVTDSAGRASAALAYRLDLKPGEARDVELLVPLAGAPRLPDAALGPALGNEGVREARERGAAAHGPIEIRVPASGQEAIETLWAQLGWIRVNRDGPAIQPGSRSYERSWIRDGALTSSALLRLGQFDAARDFARWFARYQYDDGKVPCCVDARGADPVPEHDSHGELLFLIAEVHRYTGDRAFADSLWPHAEMAAQYLERLRQERRTKEWQAPDKRQFFGLLPPSISHEGYSAKPMHSYWDDFFALRGFKDAEYLAGVTGRDRERDRWHAVRQEFERDLGASVASAMKVHGIDYVPGAADLGDFDATSTTIALSPAQAGAILPPGAVQRTFERYWQYFVNRRDGKETWDAFTPYEIRNVGAFVQLGWRTRAQEALDWFLVQRRPAEWRQWPEVVNHTLRETRFLGDLPHTWVGSDYVRSVLDCFAYVREADSALVVGAGIPWSWASEGTGVKVQALPTPFGRFGMTLRTVGEGLEVRLEGGMRVPPGGILVSPPAPPGDRAFQTAQVDGMSASPGPDGGIVVRKLPATLRFTK